MFGFLLPGARWGVTGALGPSTSDMRIVAESTVIPLENRIDAIELACAALWELMKESHGFTDDHLVAKIHEIDARDGKIDNKVGTSPNAMCPNCHRRLLTKNRRRCAWCGAELNMAPF